MGCRIGVHTITGGASSCSGYGNSILLRSKGMCSAFDLLHNSELHAPCDIGQEGQKTRAK